MSDLAIRVEDVGKQYRLGTRERYYSLRETLVKAITYPFSKHSQNGDANGRTNGPKGPKTFWALQDISFTVQQGEVVGIVGRNGAGKSTLLKILSRITEPTRGEIDLLGRVGSLLEVGTGFHPELTGRENIFLNGAILGMTQKEVKRKFDDIVAFAGIETFVDTPVKRYSSGMYVRLAFSVAAHLEPEILVVDEVLAVGDAEFQKKCLNKMSEVSSEGRTVLFVSHNMSAVTRLCTRAILLESGRVVEDGPAGDVVGAYLGAGGSGGPHRSWDLETAPGNEQVRLTHVGLYRADGQMCSHVVDVGEEIHVQIRYRVNVPSLRFRVCANFYTQGVNVFDTLEPVEQDRTGPGEHHSTFVIPAHLLAEGEYTLNLAIFTSKGVKYRFVQVHDVLVFQVADPMDGDSARGDYAERLVGLMRPRLAWHSAPLTPTS